MSKLPNCPKCNSEFTYEDGSIYLCPECGYEWNATTTNEEATNEILIVKDAAGNILSDGDSISVIKDLKVKNSSLVVKVGTKVKNIDKA